MTYTPRYGDKTSSPPTRRNTTKEILEKISRGESSKTLSALKRQASGPGADISRTPAEVQGRKPINIRDITLQGIRKSRSEGRPVYSTLTREQRATLTGKELRALRREESFRSRKPDIAVRRDVRMQPDFPSGMLIGSQGQELARLSPGATQLYRKTTKERERIREKEARTQAVRNFFIPPPIQDITIGKPIYMGPSKQTNEVRLPYTTQYTEYGEPVRTRVSTGISKFVSIGALEGMPLQAIPGMKALGRLSAKLMSKTKFIKLNIPDVTDVTRTLKGSGEAIDVSKGRLAVEVTDVSPFRRESKRRFAGSFEEVTSIKQVELPKGQQELITGIGRVKIQEVKPSQVTTPAISTRVRSATPGGLETRPVQILAKDSGIQGAFAIAGRSIQTPQGVRLSRGGFEVGVRRGKDILSVGGQARAVTTKPIQVLEDGFLSTRAFTLGETRREFGRFIGVSDITSSGRVARQRIDLYASATRKLGGRKAGRYPQEFYETRTLRLGGKLPSSQFDKVTQNILTTKTPKEFDVSDFPIDFSRFKTTPEGESLIGILRTKKGQLYTTGRELAPISRGALETTLKELVPSIAPPKPTLSSRVVPGLIAGAVIGSSVARRIVPTAKTSRKVKNVSGLRDVQLPKVIQQPRSVQVPKNIQIPRVVQIPRQIQSPRQIQRGLQIPKMLQVPRTLTTPTPFITTPTAIPFSAPSINLNKPIKIPSITDSSGKVKGSTLRLPSIRAISLDIRTPQVKGGEFTGLFRRPVRRARK